MGVPFVTHRAEKNLPEIGFPVSGGIGKIPYLGDASCDTTVLVFRAVPRKDSGWNVQPVCEFRDSVCRSVSIDVLENLDGVDAVPDSRPLFVDPSVFSRGIGVYAVEETHSLPFVSQARLIGLLIIGSEANS